MLYNSIQKDDPGARQALRQIVLSNSGVASIIWHNLLIKEAIEKSGVDMNDPEADLEIIDTTKADDILRQAMMSYEDWELLSVLRLKHETYADVPINKEVLATAKPAIINQLKLQSQSSYTDREKKAFSTCLEKLEDKFSNAFKIIANFRSIGTCSAYPGRDILLQKLWSF